MFSSSPLPKEDSPEKPIFISSHVQSYFSEVKTLPEKTLTNVDIDLIKSNIKNEFDQQTTRAYLYNSIVSACSTLLPSPKPLEISRFQQINSKQLC